jgi:hypothetical protein
LWGIAAKATGSVKAVEFIGINISWREIKSFGFNRDVLSSVLKPLKWSMLCRKKYMKCKSRQGYFWSEFVRKLNCFRSFFFGHALLMTGNIRMKQHMILRLNCVYKRAAP